MKFQQSRRSDRTIVKLWEDAQAKPVPWHEQTGPSVARYCLQCKRITQGREIRYHDLDGSRVIQKECCGCGQFFSRTRLPAPSKETHG